MLYYTAQSAWCASSAWLGRGLVPALGQLSLRQLLTCPNSVGAKNLLKVGLHYFMLSRSMLQVTLVKAEGI